MEISYGYITHLIDFDAVHRKGFKLKDLSDKEILDHAKEEIEELLEATIESNRLEELADIFGCLLHYAIAHNISLIDLDNEVVRKLKMRFDLSQKKSEIFSQSTV